MLNRCTSFILAAAALLLTVAVALGQLRAIARAAPAGDADAHLQTISLPYVVTDEGGREWQVRPDGTNGEPDAYPNDGYGKLSCNSADFPDCRQAAFNQKLNEVSLGPVAVGDVRITRRSRVDAKHGWCRTVAEFENVTDHEITVQANLYQKLAGGQRTFKVLERDAGGSVRRLLLEDGNAAVGLVGGGPKSSVAMHFDFNAASFGGTEHYEEIHLDAKQHVMLVNLYVRRAKAQEVIDVLAKLTDEQALEGFSEDQVKRIANFAGGPIGAVPRGNDLDVLETRGGARFSGTARLETAAARTASAANPQPSPRAHPQTQPAQGDCRIATTYGAVEIPGAEVVSVIGMGQTRMLQRVVTRDGESFCGRLAADTVALELPNGQVMHVPLAEVKSLGFRLPPGDRPATQTSSPAAPANLVSPTVSAAAFTPYVQLRSGDLLYIRPLTAGLLLSTRYGQVQVPIATIRGVLFNSEDSSPRDLYAVTLADGSSFGALLAADELPFHLTGAGGRRDVTLPVGMLSRLQLAPPLAGNDAAAPALRLANDDAFAATLMGKITLDTALGTVVIDAAKITSLTRGEEAAAQAISVVLSDGTHLSGEMQEAALQCSLADGGKITVPVGSLRQYTQPARKP